MGRERSLGHVATAGVTVLVLAAVGLVAGTARADVRTEARTHFRRGMALIADGRIDDGVAELQEAYDILPHPNALYNIARAYAEAGRYEEAIDFFERYLESDPADREEVVQFITALRTRISAQEDRERVAATTETTSTETTEATTSAEVVATAEEIQALEDSATQIAALAEATQSDSLRRRAEQLRSLAADLRSRGAVEGVPAEVVEGGSGTDTGSGTGAEGTGEDAEPAAELTLRASTEDVYDESVVSAARFAQSPLDAPASTTVITRQDVRLSGLTMIPEIFRRVAGVEVMTTTPVDVNLSIRGFNQRLSNRMLVLVDGRSTYIDTLGATLWATLPVGPWDVERVEIIRGPASALYGANSFSGIINIITRPPGQPATEAILGGGNGGQLFGHAQTSGRIERLAYRVAAGYMRAARFSLEVAPDRVDYSTPTTYGSPELATDGAFANASLRYRIIPEIQVSLQGGLVQRQQDFQGTGPLRDFIARGPVAHVLGSIDTPYGSVRAFYTHIDAQAQIGTVPRGGDAVQGDFTSGTLDVEAEFAQEFDLLVHHNLHVGASYRRKTIAWDYLARGYEQNHYALFIQDAMRIVDWLSIVGSFRTDFHPLLPDPVFSPRGAVLVHPTPRSTIRASVGTAFRTPTFLESYLDLQNPTPLPGVHVLAQGSLDLRPENILSVEVGYRDENSDLFDFEVNLYYNQVSSLISLTQVSPFRLSDYAMAGQLDTPLGYQPGVASYPVGTITFQNESPTFDVFGGEAMTRVYPVEGLDIYANYAFNTTFVNLPQMASSAGLRTEEARTSMHRINAGVQYRSEFGLDISVDVHFASEQRWLEQVFSTTEGVSFGEFDLPAYYMINARIGYRLFDDHLDLGIVGYNITDHRHRQHPFGQELSARFLFTVAYRM